MFRRLIAAVVLLLLPAVTVIVTTGSASAVGANVTITASAVTNGVTTLTYRATVTRAGRVRDIVMSIPSGSGGHITSVNGTVRTVSPGVLRWTPGGNVTVPVGARFSIPLYGLSLPAGGPWTLSFKATGTTGSILSSGTGTLPASVLAPSIVTIVATNPIPGQSTTLTYSSRFARAGIPSSIRMQLPAGATGAVTSPNGTLTTSGGYATFTFTTPLPVAVGAQVSTPINGLILSRFGGILSLSMSASTSAGTLLMSGSGTLPLIATPAAMPAVTLGALAPIPVGCPATWPSTTQENAKPGTGDWVIPSSMNGTLASYLSAVSTTCGNTVDLKVTSGGPVSVVAYRMGYYQGLGAREVWRQDNVPTLLQPQPTTGGTDSLGHALNMTSAADWTTTLTIGVDASWVPGTYLVKISDGTQATYAPITVRDDTGVKHALLIQQATTTWQAYNSYGGLSFYSGTVATGSGGLTFDRPYAEGQGSGQFLPLEQGLVFWAESKGLDVTYWTDNDLDEFGGQLSARAASMFMPAHDEYYSLRMRASLSQAIERGVNVANLGANAVYRNITFTDGTRRAWSIDRYTDGYASTTWRYLGDAYASQPLLGAEYVCALPGNTMTTGTSWLFDGVVPGTTVAGFVAGEIDLVDPGLYQRPGMSIVATSSGICRRSGRAAPMQVTALTAPSGARVLNGSTFAYGCFLVARCPANWTVPVPSRASQQVVGQMVANITTWVSRGQIVVPAATSAASLRVAVPKQSIQIGQQP